MKLSDTTHARPLPNRIASLLRRSGRAPERAFVGVEALENRVLLADDHPNFGQVFNTPSPAPVENIVLNGSGAGSASGIIEVVGDNDLFRFTAPANDFVRVWADTVNAESGNSTLDSHIQVWRRNPNTSGSLVAGGADNALLTGGFFTDGWAGFIAQAGQEYFIRVLSNKTSGVGSTGDYVVRVNTLSPTITINTTTGVGEATGTVNLPGSDSVFKVTAPSDAIFDSLATIYALEDGSQLDTRIEVYNANGVRLTGDSDSGNLSNSYGAWKSNPNATFYVRIRGDKFKNPQPTTSTGGFKVKVDLAATALATDPVTRYIFDGGQALADEKDPQSFVFLAQGTGLSFVTMFQTGLFPIQDSGLHIYDDTGALIGFNELPGPNSRLEIFLTGGRRYWVVAESFDFAAGGQYGLEIEAHHTWDDNPVIDDHENTPEDAGQTPPPFNTPEYEVLRRGFELATPIVWGAAEDAPQHPVVEPVLGPGPLPDRADVIRGYSRGRIHEAGDTDLFQFVPPMDMLGDFAGTEDPTQTFPPAPPVWQEGYRPGARLQLQVFGGPLFNSQVRVFDSNFNLVYDTNTQVLVGLADPSGMLDPASWPPELPIPLYGTTFAGDQPAGIEVWGGEVYYIEVSSESNTGTYTLELQADAYEDDYSTINDPIPGAGQWNSAPELPISSVTGDSSNYRNAEASFLIPPALGGWSVIGGWLTRGYAMNLQQPQPPPAGTGAAVGIQNGRIVGDPGTRGRVVLQSGDYANLMHPDDVDLYQFRATYTGTAEIRINTTRITDEFFEQMVETEDGDPDTPPVVEQATQKTKLLNSPLDSALRIFGNDFIQLAYNNDNAALDGEFGDFDSGTHGPRRYYQRDARVVFKVEEGKTYFIQVESGQKAAFEQGNGSDVDWRHATGTYELLINAMPDLNFIDDHANIEDTVDMSTLIPISESNPGNGTGSVHGQVLNVPIFNPTDTDLFQFIAPAGGSARVTVTPGPGALRPEVTAFRNGNIIATDNANGVSPVTITFAVNRGDLVFLVVNGVGTSEGEYDIAVSNLPNNDDHASLYQWHDATVIESNTYDYDGIETLSGSIEAAGDTDIFRFAAIDFDMAKITVSALGQFDSFVDVYEVGEDGAGNPILQRVMYNDNISQSNRSSQVFVPLTAPPRISGVSGLVLNDYYIVVRGVDPETTRGSYTLTLEVRATDDHPDNGQFDVATGIPLAIPTGLGHSAGVIELSGDTDIFTFTAGAQGRATVTITSPASSQLRQGVRVYDEDFNAVTDLISGNTLVLGLDSPNSTATFRFTAERNHVYYVVVQGGPTNPTYVNKTDDTGAYTVGITSPVLDDHANETEFDFATNVPLSIVDGDATATGRLEINTDSDLFRIQAIADGDLVFTFDTPNSFFTPVFRLFRGDETEIGTAVVDGGAGDEDGQVNGSITRTLSDAELGDVYYAQIHSDPGGFALTGPYVLSVSGNEPPRNPDDDYPDAGQFHIAQEIDLEALNGNGTIDGGIQFAGDSDIFHITTLNAGRIVVNVVTASGETLDAKVTIYGPQQGIVTADASGSPGVEAAASTSASGAGLDYWFVVEGVSGTTGDYTVQVDAAPAVYTLFYPEGFASRTIREFVALENPNAFAVHYTIRLRYEDPALAEVIVAENVRINPHTRDGVTLSNGGANPLHGITFGKPYAIIIESTGQLAASLSHYDFDASLGENFTDVTSSTWTFARGEKFAGQIRDFVLFYNPNPTAVVVTLTAYGQDGSTAVITQTVQGNRRSGWAFNKVAALPIGPFAFTVTSAPVSPGDHHVGIVASLSHYDLVNRSGDAVLGDASGGGTHGAIPGVVSGGSTQAQFTFYNATGTSTNITIEGDYFESGLPSFTRAISVGAHSSLTLSGEQLGLIASQPVGLRYTSDQKVSVLSRTLEFGDGTGTQAATEAALGFFFGDAFINTARAGIQYLENLDLYNPSNFDASVTVRLMFTNGDEFSTVVSVGPQGFHRIQLHELEAILDRGGNQYFSIEVTAATPIVATLEHFDLFLAGGWSTKGSTIGLATPISSMNA